MSTGTQSATGTPGVSKADQAYEALRQRIVAGRYGPGTRLVLDRIARELGVSPVPVREAVRRLEAEGYVVFRRNVGAEVASIDTARYAETMEVLAVLEAAATARAAPRLGPGDLARARRLNRELGAHLDRLDPVRFTRLNHELHLTLYQRCPNRHLVAMIEREWDRLAAIRRSTFAFVPRRAPQAVVEHDRLLDLIEAGAPEEQVEAAARRHRLATVDAFLGRVGGTEAAAPATQEATA